MIPAPNRATFGKPGEWNHWWIEVKQPAPEVKSEAQEHEEAVALGFKNAADAKEHAAWLAKNGSPEYKAMLSKNAAEQHVGRYARSVESGWLGKVVAVETMDDQIMCKMVGISELYRTLKGGHIDDAIESDDIQWFTPEDLRFITLKS